MVRKKQKYPQRRFLMNKRPLILLSNDDGIHAKGIFTLWNTLHKIDCADIIVIAPTIEKSGFGSAITWDRPLMIQKMQWFDGQTAWSIDGTPADCIKMGTRILLDRRPDFIFSGINAGSNAGRNLLHSGTVGAVIEGVLRGIPGCAFSCEDGQNPNFSIAEKYLPSLFKYIFENPPLLGSFFNINFPHAVLENVKGIRLTRQGKGRWIEDPILHLESSKGPSYWLGGKPEETAEIEDSDIALLKQGYITFVPIHIHELTDFEEINKRKTDFLSFFSLNEKNLVKNSSKE